MRFPFIVSLVMALSVAGVYWYQLEAALCPVPLSYRVGDIDPSFTITKEEAQAALAAAELVWESEVNRELFVYDENARFTVDFVFDERQATANLEEEQLAVLDEKRLANERLLAQVNALQQQYEQLTAEYEQRAEAYETQLSAYNAKVAKYNDRGGAPEDVFRELEAEKESLETAAAALSVRASQLNKLAVEINELNSKGNEVIEEYNEQVNRFNDEFGFKGEFTQGDYQGGKIHIYKFSSTEELVRVLAHEFGHALGIGHVEEDSALMYYLLEDVNSTPQLATEDLRVYYEVCGAEESREQQIRRWIRELL